MTLAQIDDLILFQIQKVSDWLHSWTGYDSIEQSRFFAGVTAVGWLMAILYYHKLKGNFDWVAAVLLIERTYRCFFENEMDAKVRSESRQGFRNHRRISIWYRYIRLCYVLVVTLLLRWMVAWQIIVWTGATITILLEACDAQTPRPGKIRESLDGLSHA